MIRNPFVTAVLLFSLAGCASELQTVVVRGAAPADREAADTDGVVRRGSLSGTGRKVSVEDCVDQAAALDGKKVRVEGLVMGVCQKKGCWMVLAGRRQGAQIRIKFKDYKYFLPKGISGQVAVVEGRLKVKKLSRRMAQHLEDDKAAAAGTEPLLVAQGRTEIMLIAEAVEISPDQN